MSLLNSDAPFAFLERSIKILIADDEWGFAESFREHLNAYELYDVDRALSAKEADSILSSSQYHVCLMDLGLNDIDNDEYFLINKYSPKVSFIVVSAIDSLEKGFKARDCGAFAAVSKPVIFSDLNVINLINKAYFQSLIIPKSFLTCKQVIQNAITTFMSYKPASMMQWAEKTGVEKRYFRKVWLECFEYQPRHVVWLYKMLSYIFSYYNNFYRKKCNLKTAEDRNQSKEVEHIAELFRKYYGKHKREVDRILTHKISIG